MPKFCDESCKWDQRVIMMPHKQAHDNDTRQITPTLALSEEYSGLIFTHESNKTPTDQHLNTKKKTDSFFPWQKVTL